ncbi:YetF domain-containing protein [Enteractinococcus helveticum]|uniref:YetF domain-containing protein n=1 Tax=Enteractinococcus helveticum TaxID=1837282 RepID=UPI000AEC4E45
MDNLTTPCSAPLIKAGQIMHNKIMHNTAQREFLTKDALYSQLRLNGFEDLSEVKYFCLEPSGQISFVS